MYYWLKDLKIQYQGACNGKISESQLFIFVQMRSGVEIQVKINQECFNISANLIPLWFLAVLSFRMCAASWRKKCFLMESVICVREQLFFFLFNIFAALKRQSCNSNAICGWKHELCSQAQRRRLLIVVFLSSRCGLSFYCACSSFSSQHASCVYFIRCSFG